MKKRMSSCLSCKPVRTPLAEEMERIAQSPRGNNIGGGICEGLLVWRYGARWTAGCGYEQTDAVHSGNTICEQRLKHTDSLCLNVILIMPSRQMNLKTVAPSGLRVCVHVCSPMFVWVRGTRHVHVLVCVCVCSRFHPGSLPAPLYSRISAEIQLWGC